ncbi:MAG: DUF359 domain-containing protein [Candidatus Thorarchaeota archaeon]
MIFPLVDPMAGTWALNLFDRLHIGHETLLDTLSDMPEPVACVTDGALMGHDLELRSLIQPLEIRVRRLKEYLRKENMDHISVDVVSGLDEILEIEGSTTFMMYEGPCCTEIKSGFLDERARILNVKDDLQFLKPVRAHDGEKVASARIRRGEIDRQGQVLRGTTERPRRLAESGRSALKAPKGDVFASRDGSPEKRVARRIADESPAAVIAVGDVTTDTLLREGCVPDVMIIDGITKRGPYDGDYSAERRYLIYNPAAAIYPEAWSAIDTAIHDGSHSLVVVDGEEDLMGFPSVLLAPVDSVVLYGQPDVGIVWIPVTPENKRLARALLDRMPIIE